MQPHPPLFSTPRLHWTPRTPADYDNSLWAQLVVLARMFPEVPAYRARLDGFAANWMRGGAHQQRRRGSVRSLPQAANAAFLLLTYANGLKEDKAARRSLECFARAQIDHILGRARGAGGGGGGSSSGRSFVVGFGRSPPQQPAHCGASCAASLGERCDARSAFERRAANPHTLVGALVAGPDADGAFADDRANLAQSRVAVDHNAALTGALAALVQARGLGKHCPY